MVLGMLLATLLISLILQLRNPLLFDLLPYNEINPNHFLLRARDHIHDDSKYQLSVGVKNRPPRNKLDSARELFFRNWHRIDFLLPMDPLIPKQFFRLRQLP